MNWQQLKIQIIPEHVDFIEPQLLAAGAVSITYLDAEDQPVFQEELDSTPLWDSLVLCALFEEDTELGELLSWLGGNASIVNRASLEVEKIEDQAWERSWMDNFSAMQFGEKLWICPSWQEPPDPSATNIMLDPGLAFGSGSHATTALCLQWLATQDLQGKDTVDYGCGSGVLAIAALRLGAAHAVAYDIDPQALTATLDNAAANGVAQALTIANEAPQAPLAADLLLANILSGPLCELAPRLAALLKPDGELVLAGLLEEQAAEVIAAYSPWLTLRPWRSEERRVGKGC